MYQSTLSYLNIANMVEQRFICDCCNYRIQLKDTFRLYDLDENHSGEEELFYRLDSCFKCRARYKIELLTQIGFLSGARYYDYPEHRLEDFHMKDFVINNIVKATENDPQIVTLKRRLKRKIKGTDKVKVVNCAHSDVFLSENVFYSNSINK